VDGKVKATKTEKILLAVTAAFLCLLLGLFLGSRMGVQADTYTVSTEKPVPQEEVVPPEVVVNINTASAEDLAVLPGIGNALALRIVEYREQNGSFGKIEDIMKVSGIGEGKFSDIRDQITVN